MGRTVIVELKAVATLAPVHQEQVIAYLAASGLPVGLLINFGATSLEAKRIFPPKATQMSAAYEARKAAMVDRKTAVDPQPTSVQSVQSIDQIGCDRG